MGGFCCHLGAPTSPGTSRKQKKSPLHPRQLFTTLHTCPAVLSALPSITAASGVPIPKLPLTCDIGTEGCPHPSMGLGGFSHTEHGSIR